MWLAASVHATAATCAVSRASVAITVAKAVILGVRLVEGGRHSRVDVGATTTTSGAAAAEDLSVVGHIVWMGEDGSVTAAAAKMVTVVASETMGVHGEDVGGEKRAE